MCGLLGNGHIDLHTQYTTTIKKPTLSLRENRSWCWGTGNIKHPGRETNTTLHVRLRYMVLPEKGRYVSEVRIDTFCAMVIHVYV
jgi:hypothetical protein